MFVMTEQLSETKNNGSRIHSGTFVFIVLILVGVAVYLAYEVYRQGPDEAVAIEKLIKLEKDLKFNAKEIDELKSEMAVLKLLIKELINEE